MANGWVEVDKKSEGGPKVLRKVTNGRFSIKSKKDIVSFNLLIKGS